MDNLKEYLKKISNTGEIISLVYLGGSRPGEARNIIPIACSESTLDAIDPLSHKKKQYKLHKILHVTPLNGEPILNTEATPDKPLLPILSTLQDYGACIKEELETAGWFVRCDDHSLSVSAFLKNGNPRKAPSVRVSYQDRSISYEWNLESEDIAEVKKEPSGLERPWRIDSWRFGCAQAYKNMHRAVCIFLEEARATNPAEIDGKKTI